MDRLAPLKKMDPVNHHVHRDAHAAKAIIYTSMVPLTTVTGSDWNPPWSGRMVGISLNVKKGDEPASSATIYDLRLNGVSVFNSNAERPTLLKGTQHSPVFPVLRGAWVLGDAWSPTCLQTGGVNKVHVTLLFVNDG